MNTLGERLKYLRKVKNVKQQDISTATGIARSNISKIESDSLNPTSNAIIALAKYFNTSTDWLLMGKEAEGRCRLSEENEEVMKLLSKLPKELITDVIKYLKFMVAVSCDKISAFSEEDK